MPCFSPVRLTPKKQNAATVRVAATFSSSDSVLRRLLFFLVNVAQDFGDGRGHGRRGRVRLAIARKGVHAPVLRLLRGRGRGDCAVRGGAQTPAALFEHGGAARAA